MRFHQPTPLTRRATVSVVVPCYNYGRFLPQAVDSVLRQPGVDVDVLIVDDASPDGSVEIARSLAAADPRVRVLAHRQNRGHIRTYNDGLAAATGDYVVLLDADDLLPVGALARSVALMERHPRVGLVYGFPASFTERPPQDSARVRSWTVWDGHGWIRTLARQGGNVIMSPEVVMRRTAWEQLDGYDPRLPHAADLAVWLHTALRWDIGRVNGPAQAYYRVHGDNMHLTTYAGMVTDLRQRQLTFDLLFEEGRGLPADADALWLRARRGVARTARRCAAAAPPGEQEELLEVARRALPGGPAAPGWPLPGQLTAAARRLGHHIQWRRWRRYGW